MGMAVGLLLAITLLCAYHVQIPVIQSNYIHCSQFHAFVGEPQIEHLHLENNG